jgi:hypothetical protein
LNSHNGDGIHNVIPVTQSSRPHTAILGAYVSLTITSHCRRGVGQRCLSKNETVCHRPIC